MAGSQTISVSGIPEIDGLLTVDEDDPTIAYRWDTTSLTFSFPDSGWPYVSQQFFDIANATQLAGFAASLLIPGVGPIGALLAFADDFIISAVALNGFQEFTGQAKLSARFAMDQYDGVSGLSLSEDGESFFSHADIRFGETGTTQAPAFGIPPLGRVELLLGEGVLGDTWYENSGLFDDPQPGNFADWTILHEAGHALGLKHGHEAGLFGGRIPEALEAFLTDVEGPPLDASVDTLEFTVMTYTGAIGDFDPADRPNFSYPQTPMMLDIQAIQYLYGADFTTNSGDTVYSWSETDGTMSINGSAQRTPWTNHIFMTIWDGNGTDTYDLSNYSVGVNVNLGPGEWSTFDPAQRPSGDWNEDGTATNAAGSIANALLFQGDTRSLIENAIGGSGDDTLIGNQADNQLDGGAGNDTLSGLAGDDTLNGNAGNDTLDGGAGNDTLNGGLGNDTAFGGSGEDMISGGAGNDTLDGNDDDDTIDGGAGDDAIFGGAGNDTVDAGDGNDDVFGGFGNDVLNGEAGNDEIEGGDGDDAIDGGTGNDTLSGEAGNDTIDGGSGDDTIFGDDGDDVLDAGVGDDFVSGGDGDDTIDGGDGSDELEGDDGNDTIRGGAGGDVISGNAGDDVLLGQDGNDTINGNSGSDTIDGGSGDDTLDGGADNDTLNGGLGNDAIAGQGGNDTIDGGSGDNTLNGGDGDDTIMALGGADIISGGAGNDTIDGGDGNNQIDGDEGNDTITAGAGMDVINGGAGDDTAMAGAGDDTVFGEAGADTLYGDAGNDTLDGGDGDDELHGGDGMDTLFGGPGNDILFGEGGEDMLFGNDGDDILSGGPGADLIDGGDGFDQASFIDATGPVVINQKDPSQNSGDVVGDVWISIESFGLSNFDDTYIGFDSETPIDVVYAAGGNDTLYGCAGDDVLWGETGDDFIVGGEGADELNGGAGYDFTSFTESIIGITIDLTDQSRNSGIAEGDQITDIEGFELTDGQDEFVGLSAHETVFGFDGNDEIHTNGGNDLVYGGTQHDSIFGGDGDDILFGEDGLDFLSGGDGNDTLDGGGDKDTLDGGLGDDILTGGEGRDNFLFRKTGWGQDTVLEFEDRLDTLVFEGFGPPNGRPAVALFDIYQSGSDVIIELADGSTTDRITLVDTLVSDIGHQDFNFI